MQSRHRVEEFIAAYNRKDILGAMACFTDDAIYQDVTYGTHSGQDELKKMLERMFLEADACWKVHTWVADARRVAIEWTIDSQITAAVPQSAGKRVRLFAMGLFEFRDGRIARYREYSGFRSGSFATRRVAGRSAPGSVEKTCAHISRGGWRGVIRRRRRKFTYS
jgi:steroid delta-isomerase-like uncharacterized protein